MSGDVEAARQMLLGGANPNSSTGGMPPLVGAVQADNPEMVKLLLEHGANPNSKNSRGDSAVLIAKTAQHPNKAIIDFLLQAGAVNPFAN